MTTTTTKRTTEERAADLFRNYGAVQLEAIKDDEPCDETDDERADRLAVNAEIRRLSVRHIRAANNGDLDE
jgi:hypothetical protein